MELRKKKEDRVVSCIAGYMPREQYNTDYLFVIDAQQLAIGSLVALYVEPNGLPVWIALVEIMSFNSNGSYIGVPVWADLYKSDKLKLEEYAYPNVKMTANIPYVLIERYMKADGNTELSHVLDLDNAIIVAYRVLGLTLPWIACRLDKTTNQWDEIDRTLTLKDMKAVLIQYTGRRDVIADWGKSGTKIYNVLDYGFDGTGTVDNTIALRRLYRNIRKGDVIFFPTNNKYLFAEEPVIPYGVRMDYQPDTIVVVKN